MRDTISGSAHRLIEKVWDFSAGDTVTWVDPSGEETQLLTIARTVVSGEGLDVDSAGDRIQENRVLRFHRPYLAGLGITEFDPAGWFVIDGERWDLAMDEPIAEALAPIGATHDMVRVTIRKAVEANSSEDATEFRYGTPSP